MVVYREVQVERELHEGALAVDGSSEVAADGVPCVVGPTLKRHAVPGRTGNQESSARKRLHAYLVRLASQLPEVFDGGANFVDELAHEIGPSCVDERLPMMQTTVVAFEGIFAFSYMTQSFADPGAIHGGASPSSLQCRMRTGPRVHVRVDIAAGPTRCV